MLPGYCSFSSVIQYGVHIQPNDAAKSDWQSLDPPGNNDLRRRLSASGATQHVCCQYSCSALPYSTKSDVVNLEQLCCAARKVHHSPHDSRKSSKTLRLAALASVHPNRENFIPTPPNVKGYNHSFKDINSSIVSYPNNLRILWCLVCVYLTLILRHTNVFKDMASVIHVT